MKIVQAYEASSKTPKLNFYLVPIHSNKGLYFQTAQIRSELRL